MSSCEAAFIPCAFLNAHGITMTDAWLAAKAPASPDEYQVYWRERRQPSLPTSDRAITRSR